VVSLLSGGLYELKFGDEQLEGKSCSKTVRELTLFIRDKAGPVIDILCETGNIPLTFGIFSRNLVADLLFFGGNVEAPCVGPTKLQLCLL
jgi:hypothetical protein